MALSKYSMKTQFITNTEGKKVGVLLTLKDYNKLLDSLEELDDIRAFDKACKEDDGSRISLLDYQKKRKLRNEKVHRHLN
jgi:hypothetical protein